MEVGAAPSRRRSEGGGDGGGAAAMAEDGASARRHRAPQKRTVASTGRWLAMAGLARDWATEIAADLRGRRTRRRRRLPARRRAGGRAGSRPTGRELPPAPDGIPTAGGARSPAVGSFWGGLVGRVGG